MSDELRARVSAFIAEHGLSKTGMARHARIPYPTLIDVLGGTTKSPRPATIAALELAMATQPPRRLPKHASVISEQWGKKSSAEIGRPLGISGARVRAIAKRMGLTAESAQP